MAKTIPAASVGHFSHTATRGLPERKKTATDILDRALAIKVANQLGRGATLLQAVAAAYPPQRRLAVYTGIKAALEDPACGQQPNTQTGEPPDKTARLPESLAPDNSSLAGTSQLVGIGTGAGGAA
jgi:hypothetical protein